ncbi:MAG: DoxX family protein [Planctomycetaceae bacterium]
MNQPSRPVVVTWLLRIALAASFLSAVADRLGLWGPPGTPNVVWGAWGPFVEYVGMLHPFASATVYPWLGWSATILEVVIALGLLIGWRLRTFAWASGGLLTLFGLVMTASLGVKPPLDYSVWTAAAASFYLAMTVERRREGNEPS